MSASPRASRPHTPGYGIPKSKKGMIEWAWVEEQLKTAKVYWVASVRPDGHPHSVPIWGNWLDSRFFFGGGTEGIWVARPTTAFAWKDGLHSATRFTFDE